MIQYRNFLIIENGEEAKEKILYDELKYYELNGKQFYYKGDINNYPQYYEYIEPWAGNCCGYWNECDKNLIIERIKKDVDYLNDLLQKIN